MSEPGTYSWELAQAEKRHADRTAKDATIVALTERVRVLEEAIERALRELEPMRPTRISRTPEETTIVIVVNELRAALAQKED